MLKLEVLRDEARRHGNKPRRRLPRCSAQRLLALFEPYLIKILQKGFRRTYCANLSDDRQGCRSDLASTGSAPECDSVSALQDHCPQARQRYRHCACTRQVRRRRWHICRWRGAGSSKTTEVLLLSSARKASSAKPHNEKDPPPLQRVLPSSRDCYHDSVERAMDIVAEAC